MVRNSDELALVSQEWADKAKESIADCLLNFMQENEISFETLCEIMPIEEDILEDILSGNSDMITMNELSAIMVCLDLVAEIKPAHMTPIQFGTGTEEENIITEAQEIEDEMNVSEPETALGCGVIISDDPKLKEVLEIIVQMFEKNPKSVDAFINFFGKDMR